MTERPEHPELDGLGLPEEDPLSDVDMTALLARRFAWDTTVCSQVPDLLAELGLVLGSPEGMDIDHRESHERLSQVIPLEMLLRAHARVVGTVLTTAVLSSVEEIDEEGELSFAAQNAELILAGARAIIAQLLQARLLQHGPMLGQFHAVVTGAGGE